MRHDLPSSCFNILISGFTNIKIRKYREQKVIYNIKKTKKNKKHDEMKYENSTGTDLEILYALYTLYFEFKMIVNG